MEREKERNPIYRTSVVASMRTFYFLFIIIHLLCVLEFSFFAMSSRVVYGEYTKYEQLARPLHRRILLFWIFLTVFRGSWRISLVLRKWGSKKRRQESEKVRATEAHRIALRAHRGKGRRQREAVIKRADARCV